VSDAYSDKRCRAVTEATERFLREVGATPSSVLAGLGERPKPGQKAAAREAYVELLQQIHALRRVVELTRPVEIVASEIGAERN
jgi:hypothetical protein